jgi:hypothetical protein
MNKTLLGLGFVVFFSLLDCQGCVVSDQLNYLLFRFVFGNSRDTTCTDR